MIALYPDEIGAWNWLQSHQSWLGRLGDDSVKARHRTEIARFDRRLSQQVSVGAEVMGRLAWYARIIDSDVSARWFARLLREAPTNEFAIQSRAGVAVDSLRRTHDTLGTLATLERLWAEAPSGRRGQVAWYAAGIARNGSDTLLIRRWTNRWIAGDRDPQARERSVAIDLTRLPAFRDDAMARVRSALAALDTLAPSSRGLTETAAQQRARQATIQRRLLAALGRALVESGQTAAGLDTLALAVRTGWNVDVFRTVQTASLTAGDTATARTMAARIAVDPRTPTVASDSLRRVVGAAAVGWPARLEEARADFVRRMLADAPTRSLVGTVELTDAGGHTYKLRDLARGRVTVVAFWSRYCGPSLEDLPRLQAVADRLGAGGVKIVSVVGESGPSPELTTFLREHRVTMPTYFDRQHQVSRAFNQWGTPYYYVLDAEGRIRFDVTTSAETMLARAEALRLAADGRSAER
jgi:thiol-disulfide isomerase/thioredoxin